MANTKKPAKAVKKKTTSTKLTKKEVKPIPKKGMTLLGRLRPRSGHRSFRMEKAIQLDKKSIAPAPKLFIKALQILKTNWRLFTGIIVIYIILDLILVGGITGASNLSSLKSDMNSVFMGNFSKLSTGLTLFTVLVGSIGSGGTNAGAGAYQTILLLLISVILIWTLRQVYSQNVVGIKDAYYQGVYPLIPFVLVLLVVSVELLPFIIGASLYSLVVGGGIATDWIERIITGLISLTLAFTSVYMLCSSLFALYIVTLPNMRPMQALRSARELVRFRRWVVLRKLIFLPFVLLLIGAIIMLPILMYITAAAWVIFFILTMLTIAVIHSYMYALYRELL